MTKWTGVQVAQECTIGNRETYEDRSYATKLPPGQHPFGFQALVAVADGMGGHNAGDVAADDAIDKIREVAEGERGDTVTLSMEDTSREAGEILTWAIKKANTSIYSQAAQNDSLKQMGTTMTVAAVLQDSVVIAHAGDSRAYSIRADGIAQITEDHSWVAEQVRAGTMNAEEARRSPMRNQITRTVGTKESVQPDVLKMEAKGDEVILVCSDGLMECLSDDEIYSIVRAADSIDDACRRLINAARQGDPQDNVTVAAVEIGMFFRLYGSQQVSAARPRPQRSAAPTSRRDRKSRSYKGLIIASAIVAAFGFGIIVRLGWQALANGEEEVAASAADQASTAVPAETPREESAPTAEPEANTSTSGAETLFPADGAGSNKWSVDVTVRGDEAFVMEIAGNAAFQNVDTDRDFKVRAVGQRTIEYVFGDGDRYAPPLREGTAYLEIVSNSYSDRVFTWKAAGGDLRLSGPGGYTCYYAGKPVSEPSRLFTFEIVPTDG